MTEDYPEFLRRVHSQDVAKGTNMHHPGDCDVCDEARASEPDEKVGLS